ncbi:hypothetical protein BJ322DRAFT_152244 [Thelephora terrestris]|uniref:DUF6535 domain-containing protein n=1 Tax=Thelephora terrestris TaxID=56493 RepID=A0A9P6L5S5_9AGAM|nr:hypothetical protein BJ322DRAFT_152244 [Thelephora terrestris]
MILLLGNMLPSSTPSGERRCPPQLSPLIHLSYLSLSARLDIQSMTDSNEIRTERESDNCAMRVDSTPGGWNSGDSSDPGDDVGENAASIQGPIRETKDGGSGGQPNYRKTTSAPSPQIDSRTLFYERYHKEAEEYDKEFMQKHGEDLNTTLIFAGLFSAVTSAFITQVQPQLQSDPNEETAALLRVLIHKIDNTTFGGEAPALPQWAGPPQTIIRVQCLLYASLFASLLAAFLAMLGRQWLSRYGSIDLRGSAIERNQDRQRKLNGVNAWYFNQVIESLPLMLQVALLLLGCALSKYLWEIDTTVAVVVAGVTSFGVLFYLYIVAVGVFSIDCPYQTPATNLIRLACSLFVRHSILYDSFSFWWSGLNGPIHERITWTIISFPIVLFLAPATDFANILQLPFWILVKLARRVRTWCLGGSHVPDQVLDNPVTELDFHCVSWILRTSSDINVKELAMSFLGTILQSPSLNSSNNSIILADCFNTFTGCFFGGSIDQTPISNGLEQLAGKSATCLLLTYSSVATTEPTSSVIGDIREKHSRLFPRHPNLQENTYPIAVSAAHGLFGCAWFRTWIDWSNYNPQIDELVPFSRALAQVVQFERRRGRYGTPGCYWMICFAFRFLSQERLPPTSVVVDCLTIIAITLGCGVPDANAVLDESALLDQLFDLVIKKFERITPPNPIKQGMFKDCATIAFLPYAFRQQTNGAGGL